MNKGSLEWFERIVDILAPYLIGIEVFHYGPERNITPKCQVVFVLADFYTDKLPLDIQPIKDILGYSRIYWINRGVHEKHYENLRNTVLFDFKMGEICPRENALAIAEKLGFTFAPEYLNDDTMSSRFLPKIYEK